MTHRTLHNNTHYYKSNLWLFENITDFSSFGNDLIPFSGSKPSMILYVMSAILSAKRNN